MRFASAAVGTILILTRIALQVEFIWQQAWSYPTVLFLCIRYLTFAFLASSLYLIPAKNTPRSAIDTLATAGAFLLVLLTFISSIYSMYSRSRRVLYINAVLFILLAGTSGVVVGVFYPQEIFLQLAEPVEGSCYVYTGVSLSMGLFPPLVFSIYLTVLAAWKWREHVSGPVGKSKQGSVLYALLVQSNLAYLLLLSVAIATVLAVQIKIKVRSVTSSMHLRVAIGGTRLTLTLRREVLSSPFNSRARGTLSESDEHDIEHQSREFSKDFSFATRRSHAGVPRPSRIARESIHMRASLGFIAKADDTATSHQSEGSTLRQTTVGGAHQPPFWDTLRETWESRDQRS
ncbi:hypothetical protein BKA62DRAFT_719124 [Auriculariales sp. MPI-PUGE-AT-0066]|nr:hypothetical protein BKA62DRAFT_719124 [Auriculariales sp. MPI-PUGE-AT-0066]